MIRRRSNIFLVLVSIMIMGVVFVLNVTLQPQLRDKFDSQIVAFDDTINQYNGMLSTVSKDSIQYTLYQETVELNENFRSDYKDMIQFYDNEDWASFYETYQGVLKAQSQIYLNSMGEKEEETFVNVSSSNAKQLAYITYLDEHHLVYEDQGYPVFALSFITSISQTMSPILILICCMYVLAQLFTMDYNQNIDISAIYPLGKKKRNATKLMLGIGFSILIFLFMLFVIFLISLCITSNTGFDYPLMIQESGSNVWKAVALLSIWKEWFILGILFYISVSFTTYLLSNYIKDEAPLFLSILCVIIGLAYLPKISSLLTPIAHYLPTTYLNFVKIVSGSIASQYSNYNITYHSGILILSISILLQSIFVYLMSTRKQRKVSFKR